MSETTNIQWCDSTWNPWRGCSKVSAGCKNCYAEKLVTRFGGDFTKRMRSKPSTFNAPLRWNKKPWVCDRCGTKISCYDGDCQDGCFGAESKAHRRRVMSLSLGDWLDPEVPVEWLADMLDIIRRCENLQFILPTKRPEMWPYRIRQSMHKASDDMLDWLEGWYSGERRPSNIIVLASVEDQESFVNRTSYLLDIPAARHGLSIEPLLGPIECLNYNFWMTGQARRLDKSLLPAGTRKHLDWVIVGGESGPGSRPCNVEWIRNIKDQCRAAGVPCFVKQLGANSRGVFGQHHDVPPVRKGRWVFKHSKGGDPAEWPEDLRVRQFYK